MKHKIVWHMNQPEPRDFKAHLAVAGIIFADVFLVIVALLGSIGLAHNFDYPLGTIGFLTRFIVPTSFFALFIITWRKLHRINARFLGLVDLANILFVGSLFGIWLGILEWIAKIDHTGINRLTGPVLFALTSASFLALCRVYQRVVAMRASNQNRISRGRRRILVVGAGDLGEALLREINRSDDIDASVAGFIDEDPRLHKTTINGVPILGGLDKIQLIVEKESISEILIAIPNASDEDMRRIFYACISTQARVRTLPPITSFVRNQSSVLPMLREVGMEEVLKRDSVSSEMAPTARYLSGERVLITGGGGSIGSELARQVASLSPASLILVGKGENSIFEIDQELRHGNIFQPTSVVCDIKDAQGLENLFKTYQPTIVFHAAAHKHVPLMEAVPIEAIRNNIFGTLNVVETCVRHGVQKFILVSTDKAVNPSNIMGATKRVAEMIISAMSERTETSFSAVRFGNVLGSRGSLVPILKKQIAAGGPVTLTHPDMTRFFMTIPEAVQLILQAGAMGEKGEIFILDMGDPVSIVELAKDMIRLHGLVAGQDIELKFTGIRPGEKIHEELAHSADDLKPSSHEKIRVVKSQKPCEWDWLHDQLSQLESLCALGDETAIRAYLMELAWGKTMPLLGTSVAVWDREQNSQVRADRPGDSS